MIASPRLDDLSQPPIIQKTEVRVCTKITRERESTKIKKQRERILAKEKIERKVGTK